MKRVIVIIGVIALTISLIGVSPTIAETEDNELVYKAAMIDGPHSSIAYGDVMVWRNGEVKVKLCVESESEQTYDIFIEFGPAVNRMEMPLGTITTDKNGKAIEYFDLSETVLVMATTPAFSIRPLSGPAVAVTGFYVPHP